MSSGDEVTESAADATCSAAIGALFDDLFALLDEWRTAVEQAGEGRSTGDIDALVYALVEPHLTATDPLVIGAGYIAAPEEDPGEALHFAWWLGPLQNNPLLGTTTKPSRLDLASREYTEYLRNYRAFEWYSVSAATRTGHITGPYVDHLCTCDYILTITIPVSGDGAVKGVVGVDVLVRRLEREVLPLLRAAESAIALVSAGGRVILSVSPSLRVGSLVRDQADDPAEDGPAWNTLACAGTELRLLTGSGS